MYSYWRLRNFKALHAVELELKPLTLLIGRNNTGKSSAYQPLMLLQSWLRASPSDSHMQPTISDELRPLFGTMRDLVWMKKRNLPISFEFGIVGPFPDPFDGFDTLAQTDPYFQCLDRSAIAFRLDLYSPNGRYWDILRQGIYDAEGRPVLETSREYVYHDKGASASTTHRPDLFSNGFGDGVLELERGSGQKELLQDIRKILDVVGEQLLGRTRILLEARTGPNWIELINDHKPSSVGYGGEHLMKYLSFHYNDRSFLQARKRLNYWLAQFGGTELLISLDQIDDRHPREGQNRLGAFGTVDDETLDVSLNLTAMGYGFKQLLNVCVECFFSPPGSTIIIDEPELHLHPEYQMRLVDMLIEVMNSEKQLILITHSENIFLRLQRRLAETAAQRGDRDIDAAHGDGPDLSITAEEVAAYHFTKDADGVAVQELEIEPDGRIPGWLPGITDTFENEMTAIVGAHRDAAAQPTDTAETEEGGG